MSGHETIIPKYYYQNKKWGVRIPIVIEHKPDDRRRMKNVVPKFKFPKCIMSIHANKRTKIVLRCYTSTKNKNINLKHHFVCFSMNSENMKINTQKNDTHFGWILAMNLCSYSLRYRPSSSPLIKHFDFLCEKQKMTFLRSPLFIQSESSLFI